MPAETLQLLGCLAVTLAAPAVAQHAGTATSGECETCHSTHARVPRTYVLKVGEPRLWVSRSGELDAASASCLRCHSDHRTRARQPEFQGYTPGPDGGPRYLGFDLSDDHLIRSGLLWLRRDVARDGRSPRRRLTPAGIREVEGRGVTCTTCHDPHARQGPLPGPEADTRLCGRCHDLSGYGGSHQSVSCSACHQLHGGDPTALLRGRGTDDACRSCHGGARTVALADGRAQAVPASLAHAGQAQPPVGRCVECHAVHH